MKTAEEVGMYSVALCCRITLWNWCYSCKAE